MKWPIGNVLSRHTFFFWPYMVSCGALQLPLNIRWCWCTPICHWLRDITLSRNVAENLSLEPTSHLGPSCLYWCIVPLNVLTRKFRNLQTFYSIDVSSMLKCDCMTIIGRGWELSRKSGSSFFTNKQYNLIITKVRKRAKMQISILLLPRLIFLFGSFKLTPN